MDSAKASTMKLTAESEWMIDHRQASVLGPGKAFEVIQTPSGTSVFFTIGSDGVLYACRELISGSTGWTRVDLTSTLNTTVNKKLVAKSFAVAQNSQTLYFDLALVASSEGSDHLYLSSGNTNNDETWANGITWKAIPFDASGSSTNVDIDNVYLMNLPSSNKPAGSLTCFVDILRGLKADNTLKLLDRYYIEPDGKPTWKKHSLPVDLSSGSITSTIGVRKKDHVPGMYTFGKIDSTVELIFASAYNYWDPNVAPPISRLKIPEAASSMTAAFDSHGLSHLFIAGQKGVYHYPPDQQKDGSEGNLIIEGEVSHKATHLSAQTINGVTGLYGISSSGDLFYTTCEAGSESSPNAWSHAMSIVSHIQDYAFFLNQKKENNTVFAHVKDQEITQLTQDPITHDWNSRLITLPSTDINDVITMGSFNTRIICQDEKEAPVPNAKVSLTATSPIGVYIGASYVLLGPNHPAEVTTDTLGVIRVYQPTQDSAAICYQAALVDNSKVSITIDPGVKVKERLAKIKSVDDLKKAKITESDGTTHSLIPDGTSDEDCKEAVDTIKQLVKIYEQLPADGSPQKATSSVADNIDKVAALIGEADDSVLNVTSGDSGGSEIKRFLVSAGDLFRSVIHTGWNALKSFVIQAANGVYQVIVKVGDTIYQAILDCAAAVTHAAEWVFQKLKVGFEKLKAFLGFFFNWKDIVRTHKVLKSVVTNYMSYGISRISNVEDFITSSLNNLEKQVNSWAGIPDQKATISEMSKSSETKDEAHLDPKIAYLQDKLKENLGKATSKSTDKSKGDEVEKVKKWAKVLEELQDLAVAEKDTIVTTIQQIKKDIIDNIGNLTPLELLKRLVAIITDLVLETAKNVVVKALEFVKELTTKVLDGLKKSVSIPVVSFLYKEIADEDLSIIDVVCLVAAVPGTLLYKGFTGENPFPDNDTTNAIIAAPDFASIQTSLKDNTALYERITVVSQFVAMGGLGFTVVANTIKIPQMTEGKPEKVPDLLKQVSIPIKVVTLMPGLIRPRAHDDPWEDQMDAVMTDLAFLKTCIDASSIGEKELYGSVSPYIDFAISAIWIVPAEGRIATRHEKKSSYLSLTTDLAYDVAIMTAPVVWSPLLDAEDKLLVLLAADGLMAITAWVHVANGKLLQEND